MPFLSRMSPIRAYKDLRLFLQGRQPYELGFFALSVVITGSLLTIIPIVVAFLGLQRFWQSGLSAGSVKG